LVLNPGTTKDIPLALDGGARGSHLYRRIRELEAEGAGDENGVHDFRHLLTFPWKTEAGPCLVDDLLPILVVPAPPSICDSGTLFSSPHPLQKTNQKTLNFISSFLEYTYHHPILLLLHITPDPSLHLLSLLLLVLLLLPRTLFSSLTQTPKTQQTFFCLNKHHSILTQELETSTEAGFVTFRV